MLNRFRVGASILLAAFVVLFASESPVVLSLRHAVFDGYQRLFPFAHVHEPVVIVAIDEKSLAAFGQWPWPRVRMAELVKKITTYKPAVIGFDVLFAESDRYSVGAFASLIPGISQELVNKLKAEPSGDRTFAHALQDGNTVLAMAALQDTNSRGGAPPRVAPLQLTAKSELPFKRFKGVLLSIPELDQAASGRGFISEDADDGIVRRAPLFARIGNAGEASDAIALSLGMEMLRVASGSSVSIRDLTGGALEVKLEDLTFPAQDDGSVWLRHSRHDDNRFVSAVDVVRGELPRDKLEGKLVLVGLTGLGLFDFKTTVLHESVPGVEIHAQLIEQLLAGVHLQRPGAAPFVEFLLMILSGGLLIWLVPTMRVQRALLMFILIGTTLVTIGISMFLWKGMLIDVAWPAISTTWILVGMLAGSLAVSDQQRRIMGEQAARIGGELMAAQRIQMGLLPDPASVFVDETRFAVAATLEPARRVGGDFYDCFMIDKNRMFFLIADVSGKGLAAALFMASAKSHLKSALLMKPYDVSAALTDAQAEVARENPEQMFVTVFAAILDVSNGRLEYVNAGHDAPFVRAPGGPLMRLQPAAGPPLCVIDDFDYSGETHQMVTGEWIFIMTDGVMEATNRRGEFFGTQRLEAMLNDAQLSDVPADIVDMVKARVHAFAEGTEPADDITLLSVRWGPGRGNATWDSSPVQSAGSATAR